MNSSETQIPESRAARRRKNRIMREQRRRRRTAYITGLVCALFVIVFTALSTLTPDKTFSANENRNLRQRPDFSMDGLMRGSFFSDTAAHFSDQFALRDRWISLKLTYDKLIGMRESHDVYLGKDHYLLQKTVEPDAKALDDIANAVNSFASLHSDLSTRMLVVPCAAAVLPDKLPGSAPVRDQAADIDAFGQRLSGVTFTNASEALRSSNDSRNLFYRTDHHWTSYGARTVYEKCAPGLGIDAPVTEFDEYLLSETFLGTLGSQSGSFRLRDTIEIYVPKECPNYYVYYADQGKTVSSLYVRDKLNEKDQYQVFLGGNHPIVEIHTAAASGRSLLIFKDSYANSFVQYLIPHYDTIIMIDPRYYFNRLDNVIQANGITDVLFLYSANTLLADHSLAVCLNASA